MELEEWLFSEEYIHVILKLCWFAVLQDLVVLQC